MKKDNKNFNGKEVENLRLSPEKRLCPIFDPCTIAEFPVAPRRKMGFRVVDNFTEEHIQ